MWCKKTLISLGFRTLRPPLLTGREKVSLWWGDVTSEYIWYQLICYPFLKVFEGCFIFMYTPLEIEPFALQWFCKYSKGSIWLCFGYHCRTIHLKQLFLYTILHVRFTASSVTNDPTQKSVTCLDVDSYSIKCPVGIGQEIVTHHKDPFGSG